jgi:hypothetical protein
MNSHPILPPLPRQAKRFRRSKPADIDPHICGNFKYRVFFWLWKL